MNPESAETKKILYIHISNPEKVIFEGFVEAITTVNEKGKFDILPMHENFISLVKTTVLVHQKVGLHPLEFKIEKGVMKVQKNKVYILVGFELLEDSTSKAAF